MADHQQQQQQTPAAGQGQANGPSAVYQFPENDTKIIPYLAALHANCITLDGLISEFVPPLANERLLGVWKTYINEYKSGSRLMILLLDESEPRPELDGLRLLGIATLQLPADESGRMRANVQNLLMSPRCRRRGGATALMAALEAEALRRGRTLLMAEVQSNSAGESFFTKIGYQSYGTVPRYSVGPDNGLKDMSFFYKHLE